MVDDCSVSKRITKDHALALGDMRMELLNLLKVLWVKLIQIIL